MTLCILSELLGLITTNHPDTHLPLLPWSAGSTGVSVMGTEAVSCGNGVPCRNRGAYSRTLVPASLYFHPHRNGGGESFNMPQVRAGLFVSCLAQFPGSLLTYISIASFPDYPQMRAKVWGRNLQFPFIVWFLLYQLQLDSEEDFPEDYDENDEFDAHNRY